MHCLDNQTQSFQFNQWAFKSYCRISYLLSMWPVLYMRVRNTFVLDCDKAWNFICCCLTEAPKLEEIFIFFFLLSKILMSTPGFVFSMFHYILGKKTKNIL